jgi:hypothetical protein
MRRRSVRVGAAAVVALALGLVVAAPIAAECDGPIPSFREVAQTARTIVIGDVTAVHEGGLTDGADGGRWSRFTLRVRHVVRGSAPSSMQIRDLPTQPCAPGLIARRGDRVAIAFDGQAFTPAMTVNTAAWIRGEPPYSEPTSFSHFESATTAAVFRLAGVAPPATDTGDVAEPSDPADPVRAPDHATFDPWPWVELLLISAGVAFLLVSRRERT